MSGIPSDQVLAILRLKQWAVDRAALKTARAVNIQHTGWRERRAREADSRIVRVLSFEQALARLDPAHQMALILTYRDGVSLATAAAALGCSKANIVYMLPAARRRLADTLDRLDLL
jgi:DNA-directed RNA polymerase specialized sigma24 family protein